MIISKSAYYHRTVKIQISSDTIPDVYEHMHTTMIVRRKTWMQAEIPKLLSEKYSLHGGACTWKLQKGKLVGSVEG
jgi:hypothetical protein